MGFADPFCGYVSGLLAEHGRAIGATVHQGGTYVCIEGPQFSTRAESKVYRQLGFDVIGMTNLQEAKLAREAEICYATMAMVTDYDVWYEGEEDVTLEQVLANVARNVETAQSIVRRVVGALDLERDCACRHAVRVRHQHAGRPDPRADQAEARPAHRQVPEVGRRPRAGAWRGRSAPGRRERRRGGGPAARRPAAASM